LITGKEGWTMTGRPEALPLDVVARKGKDRISKEKVSLLWNRACEDDQKSRRERERKVSEWGVGTSRTTSGTQTCEEDFRDPQ